MASLTKILRDMAAPPPPDTGPTEAKSITSGLRFPSARNRVAYPTWSLWNPDRWDLDHALRKGYDANEWVRVCIDRVATPAATVPWRVSRFTGKGKAEVQKQRRLMQYEMKGLAPLEKAKMLYKSEDTLEPEPGHPLEILLDEPNPFLDTQGLMESILQHLLLAGNAIISKTRLTKTGVGPNATPTGPPLQLWVINPDHIQPVKDKDRVIARYEAPVPGQTEPKKISTFDILHFRLHNPADPTWGTSPLKSAAMVIDGDIEAMRWNKYAFENRAVPDGIFFTETGGVMRAEDFEEQRRQLRSQYQSIDNARTPILAANISDFRQLSLSPAEMDFIKTRELNRLSICAIFGVNPIIAGVNEGASYGSIKEVKRDHWVSVILPALDRVQAVLNRHLAKEFGDDVYLWYDVRNVEALRESHHEKVRSAGLLARNGVPMTALNRIYDLGLTEDELDGLDIGYMPASTRSVKEILRMEEQARLNPNPQNPNSESPDGGEQIEDNPNGQPSPGEQDDPMDADSNRKAVWDIAEVMNWLADHDLEEDMMDYDGEFIVCDANTQDNKHVLASIARGEIDGVTLVPIPGGGYGNVELRFYSPQIIRSREGVT